jgi:hypothetical protein
VPIVKETNLHHVQPVASKFIIDRLTALWALNEAGLGGLMHAIKSPFTGIFVGGMAIILIAMIAYHADKKTITVLKATSIVLIVKALVSPHSPFPAYLAVGFQGVAGAILFKILPSFRLAALTLGVVGLSESAWQKLVTLTLIYGNSLWQSIDLFFNYIFQVFGLTGQNINLHVSITLISLYLGLYLLAGFLIGYLAGIMPAELIRTMKQQDISITQKLSALNRSVWSVTPSRQSFWKKPAFSIGLILVAIIVVLTLLNPELKGIYQAIYVLLRTCVIIAAWYFVVAPLVTKLLGKFLSRKKQEYSTEVQQILLLLPQLRGAAVIIWNHAKQFRLLRRVNYFLLTLISYTLSYQPPEKESGSDDLQATVNPKAP